MAFTPQDWSQDLTRLQSALTSLRTTHQTSPSSPSPIVREQSKKQLQNIEKGYTRLTARLVEMEESAEMRDNLFDVTGTEISRFKFKADSLGRMIKGFKGQLEKVYGGGSGAGGGGGDMDIESGHANTGNGNGNGKQSAYVQTTQTVMDSQDDLLSSLSTGVTRLHTHALNINQESNLHVRLLEDMDTDVDQASNALVQETRHAMSVRGKTSTCRLYMAILGLSVLMVFLIVLGVS